MYTIIICFIILIKFLEVTFVPVHNVTQSGPDWQIFESVSRDLTFVP